MVRTPISKEPLSNARPRQSTHVLANRIAVEGKNCAGMHLWRIYDEAMRLLAARELPKSRTQGHEE